jgi:hypothetical protein
MSAGAPRTRSLWPREHGAYVQLLVPLATALLATTPTLAGAAIALGAGLAFLASEPLRVVLGDRGPRRRELARARARSRLAQLAAGALIAGGAGLALAPTAALAFAGVLALPIGLVVVLSRRGAVHTVVGESVAAIGLAGASAPVAIAGGMSPADALVIWCAWSAGYATSVIAVHQVLARHRRAASRADVPPAIALGALCAVIAALGIHDPAAWLAIPLAALAALVVLRPPRATRLRAVGVGFLLSSVVAAACAVTTVRLTDPGAARSAVPGKSSVAPAPARVAR